MSTSDSQENIFVAMRKDLALLIEEYQCFWLEDPSLGEVEYIFTGLDRANAGEVGGYVEGANGEPIPDPDEEEEVYQFHFNSFEGSFDGTIYTWIHQYLKSRNLYKEILSDKLLVLAHQSSGPFRPTLTISTSDELYTEAAKAQDYIEFLENEAILIIGIMGIYLDDEYSKVNKYFTDYEMDNYKQRLSDESEDFRIIEEILN